MSKTRNSTHTIFFSKENKVRGVIVDNSKKLAVFFDLDDTLYDHLVPFRKAVTRSAECSGRKMSWIMRIYSTK
jgi:hypothetical protein